MGDIEEIYKSFRHGGLDSAWKLFINSIEINGIHGWQGQTLRFNFPVTVLVGENGVGKSTFLKAAACAYRNLAGNTFYPSNMFVSTQWDESALANATITYDVRQGNENRKLIWRKKNDWGFTPKSGKPERNVYFLDISRTLPLDATAGYAKIAKQSNKEAGSETVLSEESIKDLSYVLGRSYSNARFVGTDVNAQREVGLLSNEGREISQFHQGAGEDAMLDMFKLLQSLPSQSLLIIDEVENSLHPQAQRRFVRHLLHLARVRKLQVILSTHSPFVLDELPESARVMLTRLSDRKEIIYDVSTSFALATLDDGVSHPELFVFMEDDAAESLFWAILKRYADADRYQEFRKNIATRAVGSWTVVNELNKLSQSGKLPYRSLCIVDGDKRKEAESCMALPGDSAPEKQVLLDLKAKNWCRLDERFGLGAGALFHDLDAAVLLKDHHKWTEYIGDHVRQSKDVVWNILADEWCTQCLDEDTAQRFIEQVSGALHR